MIESIRLRNYQSHEDTQVEFSPGVTAIVGSSDSGKTSVLRAISTILTNKPMGDSLVSHWSKEDGKIKGVLSIDLVVDGHAINRIRTASKNWYTLDIKDPYKAFGTEVPQPILDLLNMSDVNVQGQHDSVFLLADSPGQVAKKLNQVVNLDDIDTALSVSGARHRKNVLVIKVLEEQEKQTTGAVEKLDWIDQAIEDVDTLELAEEMRNGKRIKMADLSILVQKIEAIDLSDLDWIDNAQHDVDIAVGLSVSLEVEQDHRQQISSLVESIEAIPVDDNDYGSILDSIVVVIPALDARDDVYNKRVRLSMLLANVDNIPVDDNDYDSVLESIATVVPLSNQWAEIISKSDRLENLLVDITNMRRKESAAATTLVELNQEFKDQFPEECPLCGKT